MLKHIPPIISPDLMHVLMRMGHGDEVVLADGNFPAETNARRLVRADGHGIPRLLEAIARFLPLDDFVEHAAFVMQPVDPTAAPPPVWDEFRSILAGAEGKTVELKPIERFAFYERAKQAFAIVATSETAIYGNLILKKGVVDLNATPPALESDSTANATAELIERACLWEATARKAGNVHPAAAFADTSFADFTVSAAAIGKALGITSSAPLGERIYRAVAATREVSATNTNLGMILLLAPLSMVPAGENLRDGVRKVLRSTTVADAERLYAAIRLAQPGGLGTVPEADITETPTITLVETMRLAADRDLIARQYVTDFVDVLAEGVEFFRGWELATEPFPPQPEHPRWELTVQGLQLSLMATRPDTLIARKCGAETAETAMQLASDCLDQFPDPSAYLEFDRWLRADGHRRNPGTTADLIAAILFAVLRESPAAGPTLNELRSAPFIPA